MAACQIKRIKVGFIHPFFKQSVVSEPFDAVISAAALGMKAVVLIPGGHLRLSSTPAILAAP